MNNVSGDSGDVRWLEAKDDFVVKRDEKLVLGVYRFVRTYYQFFIGFLIGVLVMGLIVK